VSTGMKRRVLSRVLGLGIVRSSVVSFDLLLLGRKYRFHSDLLSDSDWIAKFRW